MTYHPDCTLPTEFLDQIADGGLEALPEAMRLLLNAAMLLERQKFIGAGPYQRTPERRARAQAGAGGNVCPGRLDPQGGGDYGATLWLRGLLDPGQPRSGGAGCGLRAVAHAAARGLS